MSIRALHSCHSPPILGLMLRIARPARCAAAMLLPLAAAFGAISCGSPSSATVPRAEITRASAVCRTLSVTLSHPQGVLGSCPSDDVVGIAGLIHRFRRAVTGTGSVCALLTANYRANAERWASENGSICDVAVERSGNLTAPRRQISSPVRQILLVERGARAGAVIRFRSAAWPRSQSAPQPINIAVARTGDDRWQIS